MPNAILAIRVGHLVRHVSFCAAFIWCATNLQNPAREVLIIINAAITLASLRHEVAVEPRVGARRHGLVIMFNRSIVEIVAAGLSLLEAVEEESCTNESKKSDNANDNASCDGCRIRLSAIILFRFSTLRFGRRGYNDCLSVICFNMGRGRS